MINTRQRVERWRQRESERAIKGQEEREKEGDRDGGRERNGG